MIECPHCKSKIVWRFSIPQKKNFCCNKCGHMWNESLPKQMGQYGEFIGYWVKPEIDKLEEELSPCKPLKWHYFKGRNIWTAWHSDDPNKMIACKSLKDLIFWIKAAVLNPKKWYESFINNLSK